MGKLDSTCTAIPGPTSRARAFATMASRMAFSLSSSTPPTSTTAEVAMQRCPAARVGTLGCQIGYMDYIGCHQFRF
jgi:hypothetical protein